MSWVVGWGQLLPRMSREKVADQCRPGEAYEVHSTPHGAGDASFPRPKSSID